MADMFIYIGTDKCCWVYVVNKNKKKGRKVERFNNEDAENRIVCLTAFNSFNRTGGFVLS